MSRALNLAFLILLGVIVQAGLVTAAIWYGKSEGRQQASAPEVRHTENLVAPHEVFKTESCVEQARMCFQRRRMERTKAGT